MFTTIQISHYTLRILKILKKQTGSPSYDALLQEYLREHVQRQQSNT